MATFKGETGEMAPILGANFWIKGRVISGKVISEFKAKLPEGGEGLCWQIKLLKPVTLKSSEAKLPEGMRSQECEVVSIGNMKGFQQAVEKSGAGVLKVNDTVVIEATGERETGQKSPMVLFSVEVNRP